MQTPNVKEFIDILRDPKLAPSPELVETLHNQFPFFSLPSAIMLQRCGKALSPATTATLQARVALTSNDPTLLYRLTGEFGETFSQFYPASPKQTPGTTDAIATFLDRYAGNNDNDSETALLEKLIFNPVPADYGATLERDEPAPTDTPKEAADTISGIANILDEIASLDEPNNSETIKIEEKDSENETPEKSAIRTPEPAADTTFSESLAKIYIKQQRFDKALEIISSLNLKYPEKSVYFADQMRFLKKLIQNRSYNSQE